MLCFSKGRRGAYFWPSFIEGTVLSSIYDLDSLCRFYYICGQFVLHLSVLLHSWSIITFVASTRPDWPNWQRLEQTFVEHKQIQSTLSKTNTVAVIRTGNSVLLRERCYRESQIKVVKEDRYQPEVSVSRSDLVSRMFKWSCANKNDEIEAQIKSGHHHRNKGNS